MNFWKPIILFVFMTAGLFSFQTEARRPAVEPVMGLSIEEYENVTPEQSQGFNFERPQADRPPQNENVNIDSIRQGNSIAPRNLINQPSSATESSAPATLFYILLSLLPFIVWFGLMKNLDAEQQVDNSAEMYDLEEQRRKRQKKDDDIPKAS